MAISLKSFEKKKMPSLQRYFDHLYEDLGPQQWWPAKTQLEVVLGAILTQNTRWKNAEMALQSLRTRKWLQFSSLRKLKHSDLAKAIRPAGFFQQKATTIKNFLSFLDLNYDSSFKKMFNQSTHRLREQLMQIKGFGPETVDTILLYGGQRPTFIVDAYTRRILERHGLISPRLSYDEVQTLFHNSLDSDPAVFNEYHALLVGVGKTFCKKGNPDCHYCPLKSYLPSHQNNKLTPEGYPRNML